MFDLPRDTHRYLIEPVSQSQHLKFTLMKRFLQFKEQVSKCPKLVVRKLFKICQFDTGSVTGSNFRKIMLMCDKTSTDNLEITDIDNLSYSYFEYPVNERWRTSLITELIDMRKNVNDIFPEFSIEEFNDLMHFECTS